MANLEKTILARAFYSKHMLHMICTSDKYGFYRIAGGGGGNAGDFFGIGGNFFGGFGEGWPGGGGGGRRAGRLESRLVVDPRI